MEEQGMGSTALGAAICRLIEQYQPRQTRLFDDPVVRHLVGVPIGLMMQFGPVRYFTIKRTDSIAKGIYGEQVCRTRFIDDTVRAALSEGVEQLVILGAGFDTRPYRLLGLKPIRTFEVDLPAVQSKKKSRIQSLFGRLPEHVAFVPVDFRRQTVEGALAQVSFAPSKPSVFVWQGVTQYLSEEAVKQTLSFVGKTALGSKVVLTYVLKNVIERRSDIPGANKIMDAVSKRSPWMFGLEPSRIREYLGSFHLELRADVGKEHYEEEYLKPLRRHLPVFEGERTALALVTPF